MVFSWKIQDLLKSDENSLQTIKEVFSFFWGFGAKALKA